MSRASDRQLRNQAEDAGNVANLDGLLGREEALMNIESAKFSISYSEEHRVLQYSTEKNRCGALKPLP